MVGAAGQTKASGRRILFLGADAEYMFKFRANLMVAAQARGWDVHVAAARLYDFDVAKFAAMSVTFTLWDVAKAGINPLRDAGSLLQLRAILARLKPDILFAHTIKPVIYGGLLAAAAGVPRRVAMIPGLGHTFMPPKSLANRLSGAVARAGYRAALARDHMIIFHNPDDMADMRRAGVLAAGAPAARVYGSGVDMAHFAAQPFPDGPPRFLMLARLLREKGVFEFIEAARIVRRALPRARFALVGAPDANPSAASAAEIAAWRAEGIVDVPGPTSDPRPDFASSHVFVLPSWREGTPRTNLEAMAIGRAIVTTDAPGCRETVRHGVNGLLVPARNPRALAAAMIELGSDLARAKAMGEAGLAWCRQTFELGAVTQATIDLVLGET
jgi:glycosyltransferase involved in cell wall biosynthesis